VRTISRRLLAEQLTELTAIAVDRVNRDEPEYARSLVSHDDLNRSMRRTLALALTRLAGDPIPDELRTAAAEVGRLRAEQGLPLAALLHSYRIDLRILWEAMIREGRAQELVSEEGFLESSILVWEAVEANIAEVVEAYRRAQEDMAKSLDVVRDRAFERLVLAGDGDEAAAREAARRLDLPADAEYLVVVGDDVPVDHAIVVAATARLGARGLASYLGWTGGEFVGVVRLDGRGAEFVLPHLDMLSGWRCGAAVVEGLTAVPRGVRLARAVIAAHAQPGVRLLSADWPAVLVAGNEELARALATTVMAPLLALPDGDRAAVFETLEAYIAGSGSVGDIASQTLRHRNTVRNRLQTVERLTGLSLSRPRDIAVLVLAMAWPGGAAARRSGS
jgi:hypothetical protein